MGAEYVVVALSVAAGLLVLVLLRQERRHGRTPPFALGFYRGCAFLIILFAAFAWGSIVLGWFVNRQS